MGRRRKEPSLSEVLMDAPWWVTVTSLEIRPQSARLLVSLTEPSKRSSLRDAS